MKKIVVLLILFISVSGFCSAETITALTSGNRLLFLDSATPGTITKTLTITTIGNEPLLAIDFRPATGNLYALAVSGRVYEINLTTGSFLATEGSRPTLNGTAFGFDFNPTVDRIRVTSNNGQNLRLNSDGTLMATDTALAYAPGDPHAGATPSVVGSAYTNNFAGAIGTVLYDIDAAQDALLIQNPPDNGTLNTVGPLGVDTSDTVGFDISQGTGQAYASLTVGGTAALYTVSLANGAATLVGNIASGGALGSETILDIAVPTATRLLNIATRGEVGTGEDVLIGGFISRGGGRIVLRAIGPSLSAFGVASPLQDPVLTLKNESGFTLAANDDWQSSQAADIAATGLAPSHPAESAILTSLPAGSFTAIVSGKGSDTGVALVEIYQLP